MRMGIFNSIRYLCSYSSSSPVPQLLIFTHCTDTDKLICLLKNAIWGEQSSSSSFYCCQWSRLQSLPAVLCCPEAHCFFPIYQQTPASKLCSIEKETIYLFEQYFLFCFVLFHVAIFFNCHFARGCCAPAASSTSASVSCLPGDNLNLNSIESFYFILSNPRKKECSLVHSFFIFHHFILLFHDNAE